MDVAEVVSVEVNENKLPQESVTADNDKGGKKKRKLTSRVWSYFDMLPVGPDEKERCKCKKCGIIYIASASHGTGNMIRHISICPQNDTRDISQMLLSQSEGSMSVRSCKIDNGIFRELMTKAIIMHDLPFSFVEYEGIRDVLRYIHPDIQLITRNTCKADVLKLYKMEKAKIASILHSIPRRISLTSDLWTSIATDGYLSLTAHFVDNDWQLQKRIIGFCFMPPPHNVAGLSEKIFTLLVEWGIVGKLFSITLDNASVNLSFVEMLKRKLLLNEALLCDGEFFHSRCCAHILNLIVQEGLKEIDESIQKIRETVKYIKGSQARKQKFLDCVKHVSLQSKKGLRQDVPTRWNSTYLMLESAIFYKRALLHLELSDSNYKYYPSQEEWDKIERICKLLAVFYSVTCMFSGSKYPTANLYFPLVFLIQVTLIKGKDDHDIFVRRMATQMFTKFEKYWSDYSLILSIACVLDPRYKIQFVDFCYRKLYGSNSFEMTEVRDKLFSLFDTYMRAYGRRAPPSSGSAVTQEASSSANSQNFLYFQECEGLWKEFDTERTKDFLSIAQKSQLELYLDEPIIDRKEDIDVLNFWKGNQCRYPELSLMACDILSIPVSTVASESAFSGGGRVLDQYRSVLKPEIAEALVCTRDWLYGNKESLTSLNDLTEDVLCLNISNDVCLNISNDEHESGQGSTAT